MKTLELALGKRYVTGSKLYLKGEQYVVTESAADELLAKTNENDVPYFREVEPVEVEEQETPKPTAKKNGLSACLSSRNFLIAASAISPSRYLSSATSARSVAAALPPVRFFSRK